MTTVSTVTAAGTQGFDSESVFSPSQISTLWTNSPYLVAMADAATASTSAIQSYVNNLLSQGFYVGIYRGFYSGMFDSNPSSVGSSHAQECVDVANGFSGAKGMTLWCDLEGATSSTTASDIIAYANAFTSTCASNGYQGGVYVGDTEPNVQLNGSQLYNDLTTSHYWRCASSSIFTTIDTGQTRGWQILQTSGSTSYNGVGPIDNDSIQTDNLGENAVFIRL